MEKTFMLIKPDGVKRKLVGNIIKKIEDKGLTISKLVLMEVTKELAELHYKEHRKKSFYEKLIKFITSGPVIAMVIQGDDVVEIIRKLAGKTNPKEANYGTIRGDFAFDLTENVVHTSDSIENAEREIENFFG